MTEKETWSMEDLMNLTDEVQTEEMDYRGKTLSIQFCELTESEEPKMKGLNDAMTEEEKMELYQKIGSDRCLKMIEKANSKNPEGETLNAAAWAALPTTLRYQIANKILGVEGEVKENFTL